MVVAFPRSADEIVAALTACRELGVPLVGRGAGTSIAGNALSTGLVLDTSRHLNRVLSVDPERRTAVVQPGTVLDHRLTPSAVGVAGDIYLAGSALAQGYPVAQGRSERVVLVADLVVKGVPDLEDLPVSIEEVAGELVIRAAGTPESSGVLFRCVREG